MAYALMNIADVQFRRNIICDIISFLLLASTASLGQVDARALVSKMAETDDSEVTSWMTRDLK